MRNIVINPALNGYIVNVGCQQVVFQGRDALVKALDNYLRDPIGTENEFLKNAVNKMEPAPMPPDCNRSSPQTAGENQVSPVGQAPPRAIDR